MGLLLLALVTVLCWGVLILALARGVFVIPRQGMLDVLKRSARLTLFAGLPACFVLAVGAGELTNLLPLAARWPIAAIAALASMPYYAMLITVIVVERDKGRERTRGGLLRLLSQLAILLISGSALLITLGALFSTLGPFMGR